MNFVICDDMAPDRAHLLQMLRQYCLQNDITAQVEQFADAGELLAHFAPKKYQILFLDVYMPGLSGMEAAQRIREQDTECMLIFTTTSEEHALESYRVYAAGYLLKPYGQESLDETLDWCIQNLPPQTQLYEIISERERVQIVLGDIVFIEIYGRNALFHTTGQTYSVHRRLSEIGKELPGNFIRCHRSYIVNMQYIVRVENADFHLKTGQRVPIGSEMGAKVKQAFFDWAFQRTWEGR